MKSQNFFNFLQFLSTLVSNLPRLVYTHTNSSRIREDSLLRPVTNPGNNSRRAIQNTTEFESIKPFPLLNTWIGRVGEKSGMFGGTFYVCYTFPTLQILNFGPGDNSWGILNFSTERYNFFPFGGRGTILKIREDVSIVNAHLRSFTFLQVFKPSFSTERSNFFLSRERGAVLRLAKTFQSSVLTKDISLSHECSTLLKTVPNLVTDSLTVQNSFTLIQTWLWFFLRLV